VILKRRGVLNLAHDDSVRPEQASQMSKLWERMILRTR